MLTQRPEMPFIGFVFGTGQGIERQVMEVVSQILFRLAAEGVYIRHWTMFTPLSTDIETTPIFKFVMALCEKELRGELDDKVAVNQTSMQLWTVDFPWKDRWVTVLGPASHCDSAVQFAF